MYNLPTTLAYEAQVPITLIIKEQVLATLAHQTPSTGY